MVCPRSVRDTRTESDIRMYESSNDTGLAEIKEVSKISTIMDPAFCILFSECLPRRLSQGHEVPAFNLPLPWRHGHRIRNVLPRREEPVLEKVRYNHPKYRLSNFVANHPQTRGYSGKVQRRLHTWNAMLVLRVALLALWHEPNLRGTRTTNLPVSGGNALEWGHARVSDFSGTHPSRL